MMATAQINPLARGFYTIPDAARLIESASARRIRGWLGGYTKRNVGPLLVRDYEPFDSTQELSFLDLMEVRFVEHFLAIGVKSSTMRQCLKGAREKFGESKPILKKGVLFIPTDDRRKVIVEEVFKPAAKENSDMRLWSLINKNFEFQDFIESHLERGLSFDPETEVASSWVPRPREFPKIVIHPAIAYGQPATPNRIATSTIYDSWLAEDEDEGVVADWYNVPLDEVAMAVGFERLLNAEAMNTLQ